MNSALQPSNLYQNYQPTQTLSQYYYYPPPEMGAMVPNTTPMPLPTPNPYFISQQQLTQTGGSSVDGLNNRISPQTAINSSSTNDNGPVTTAPPHLAFSPMLNANTTPSPFQVPSQMYPQVNTMISNPFTQNFTNDMMQPTPAPQQPPPMSYPIPLTQPSQIPQYYPTLPMMLPGTQYGVGTALPQDPNVQLLPQPAKAVEHFRFGSLQPSKGKLPPLNSVSKTNLYLSGLGEKVTDAILYHLVEKVVTPKSCKALLSSDGKCNGIGFIDCHSEEDAKLAQQHIEKLVNNYIHEKSSPGEKKERINEIDFRDVVRESRVLEVKFAHENAKDVCNIYVRNLPKDSFTNDDLRNQFSQYGHVISVKLLSSQFNGCQTGIGFVRMSTEVEARRAIESVNRSHVIPRGSDMPLRCQLADKSDRRSVSQSGQMSNSKGSRRFSAGNISSNGSIQDFGSAQGSRSDMDQISQSFSQMQLMNSQTGSYPTPRIQSPYQQMMSLPQHPAMISGSIPASFVNQGMNSLWNHEIPCQSPQMAQSSASPVAQTSRASASPHN
jgi:RNA recognition motif-containing protein